MFRTMRRSSKQEVSHEECVRILREGRRGALGVHGDDGYPYVIPLNFYYDEETERIYFHGAKAGHKIDAIRSNEKVCFTVWDDGYLKEGDWAYYVTSVVAFGKARLVTEEELTYKMARNLGLKYFPTVEKVDKDLAEDLHRVQIVEISIEHITGKLVHEE